MANFPLQHIPLSSSYQADWLQHWPALSDSESCIGEWFQHFTHTERSLGIDSSSYITEILYYLMNIAYLYMKKICWFLDLTVVFENVC